MLDLLPIGAGGAIGRQVRRVRRRWNLHAAQRGLYLVVATAGVAATVVVLLALFTGPRLFAGTASGILVAAAAVTAATLRGTTRRWLRRAGAPLAIDAHAHLDGRLATLVELDAAGAGDPFFRPLLVRENERVLPAWQPARLVPRPVPLAALAAALAASAALVGVLALAPVLAPRLPDILYADRPITGESAVGLQGIPERVVISREAPHENDAEDGRQESGIGAATLDEPPTLQRLATELQDRIRSALWGEEWKRAAEAMARAERERRRSEETEAARAGGQDEGGGKADAEGESWEMARLAPPEAAGRRAPAPREERAAEGAPEGADAAGGPSRDEDEAGGAGTTGEAASGAGTATSPDLYGTATPPGAGADAFPLGITARLRAPRSGPRPPSGETPPAEPDARPELAARQRAEAPVERLAVPAAYEPIVSRIFAHGGGSRP